MNCSHEAYYECLKENYPNNEDEPRCQHERLCKPIEKCNIFSAYDCLMDRCRRSKENSNASIDCQCSKYDCFFNFRDKTTDIDQSQKIKCKYEKLCSPVSLPPQGNYEIPICNTEEDRVCHEKLLSDLIAGSHCKRKCVVKEFQFQMECNDTVESEALSGQEPYAFKLNYRFHAQKVGSSAKILKTIKREYLLVTWISLVENIGGTLGFFVGFSLLGTCEWLTDSIAQVLAQGNLKFS